MLPFRSPLCILVALVALVPLGCGTSPAPAAGDYVEVTGTASVAGAPLKRGTIHFKPEEAGGREEVCSIADGKFALKMFKGKYRVAFDVEEARSSVPAKFRSYSTSDANAEIKSSGNDLQFQLK